MVRRLRVLFSIGSLSGGGSERQLVTLIKHLDRAKFEPVLYLIYRKGEFLEEVPEDVPIYAFDDHVRRQRWYIPGLAHRMRVVDMTRVLREQKIDVSYDRTFHMTLIAGPATARARVPRVSAAVTNPNFDLSAGPERFQSAKKRLLSRWYGSAFRVVAVSEGVRRGLIRQYGLSPEMVTTIHNPVDIEHVRSLAQEPVERYPPDRFHVVTGGRLHPQKGHQYLVQAIDLLVNSRGRRQVVLHIVGSGELQPQLEQLVRDKGLGQNVVFHGFQTNPFRYYRAAHLFCLPSVVEGMPNALVEAMACGVPVLATDCESGPREILAGGEYGRLVAPADAGQIATAIGEAIDNYEKWQKTAASAQEYVQQRFSMAAGLQPLEELLLTAAGR